MNGRVYDPVLGRMMSADPFVQDLIEGQNWNRYTYALNNPLAITDPNGYFFKSLFNAIAGVFKAVGSIVKSVLSNEIGRIILQVGAFAACHGNPYCAAGVDAAFTAAQGGDVGDVFKAAVLTFASTRVLGSLGKGKVGFLQGAHLEKIALHAAVGCVSAAGRGGNCGAGALSGGFAAAAGPLVGDLGLKGTGAPVARAVIGGTASVLGGGKFANGAVTAAFIYLYNDSVHREDQYNELVKEYDVSDPNFHMEGRMDKICSSSSPWCDSTDWDRAFEGLRRGAYPGQYVGDPVIDEGKYSILGTNPIQTLFDRGNLTIFNVTLPGHEFHSGFVMRQLIMRPDGIYVATQGIGTGGTSCLMNSLFVIGGSLTEQTIISPDI
jgi:hypothetical protein